ncbi:MAG: hypothetical protein OEQ47_06310 [Acidimicrobiia bacterium]|nr:hypothetical protein [Acidimicrobiia bacterium]
MKHRVALLAAAALVAAACGGEAAVETTAAPDVAVTTAAPTTTAVPETTTTTAAPEATTTTEAPVLEASVSPQLRRIQAAMAQSTEVPSARMVGDIRIVGIEDFDGEITFSFEGAFDNRTGDSSFSLDLSSFGDVISAQIEAESTGSPEDEFGAAFLELFLGLFTKFEVRQVGDTVYMNNPMLVSFAGGETEWIASPAEGSDDIASGFLQDSPTTPADVLDPFSNGNAEVIEVGQELVRGVETTHYQLVYDKESLLESAPAGERAELEQELEQFGDDLMIDVWMDDQYLYKIFFDIDGTQVVSEEGDSFERMTMTYEIFDYGADIVIEAPPADQVTFVEQEALSPGLGFGFND